tara:strand:- start:891 stop:1439 length:549 start_codon:yes stop_codon:yes gene_type:complete
MAALKPVGSNQVISSSGTSAQSSAISQQSDSLRIVAETKGVHVAIGTNPTAVATDFYVSTGQPSVIRLGQVSSQRVVGITTGGTTTIDFPEGTGCPFDIGDAVTLVVTGQGYYDFSHKILSSVDTSSGVDGFFSTRVTINHDSSGIATAFNATYAELRKSFKVAVKTTSGSGTAFIQQVQDH